MSRRQNEYFDAVEAAKIDLRDKFDEKHKTRVKSLSVSLERAAKWNDEVAEGEKEAADMGYKIEPSAWKELFPDRPLAASKLATWQRSTKEYLDR